MTAGSLIVDQGQTGREAFVILDGNVTVKRNGRKVATLGPGAIVGELSLLDHGPRTATVGLRDRLLAVRHLHSATSSPCSTTCRRSPTSCWPSSPDDPRARPPVLRLTPTRFLHAELRVRARRLDASSAMSHDRARMRPHHLVIGLGIAFAVFTVLSGVVPLITEWHDDSAVHREVFGDIPGALQLAFYIVIPLMLAWGAFQFADRVKNWERGRRGADPPHDGAERPASVRRLPAGVYMRTLLRDPAAGLMHSLIYFGFLVLLAVTTVLEIDHQLPEDAQVPARPAPTRRSPRSATPPAWCSSPVCCGRSPGATSNARTASASRPSPSTR